MLRSLVARFWREPYQPPRLARWGTEVHDRFMLPYFVQRDLEDVVAEQNAAGFPLKTEWFAPHLEVRFPKYGDFATLGTEVELRQALEPWHVMGEEGAAGGAVRYVDSSVERLQVLVTGLAFILMTFPRARQLGASLLASAGVAGLIVGIAARSVFSNLLAGLQIALAQPIRIDDVLIVEGEWGRVEEITATYVVLKIWDERSLIVPLGWFIEHPFQNWTRRSADILGTVLLWVDYTLPVEAVRKEAQRLCEASPHWDRRVCAVQVTEATERAMQLRVLVSSSASGPNFDLRCELREALIDFIQREFPQGFPRVRADYGEPVGDALPQPQLSEK